MEEVKKTTAKVVAKAAPAVKAAEEKKPEVKAAAPVKKAAKVEETVNFQFSGKSYTPDDLMKIFRDVWKYDMNGREEDIRNVELYVKPEENTTYFVVNGSITGSFFI